MLVTIKVTVNDYDETTDTVRIGGTVTYEEDSRHSHFVEASLKWGHYNDSVATRFTAGMSVSDALSIATILLDKWQETHDEENPGDSPVCTTLVDQVFRFDL